MENEKWSCKRKFSETNHSETENFGSISSHSERYSDDKDAIEASQSPDVLSKASTDSEDVNDGIRSLTEKLSAALIDVSAKEDLVKQHSVVAEEAIAGWEKAENEVAVLKQKLEDAARRNSALEDRLSRLDGALKECVKQLRQAREEQEQKVVDWEATKFELESRLLEFQEKAKFVLKIEDLEKENSALKLELSIYVEEMEIRTIERDLSTEAAETASKQYLESIKKLARLEAECRRLKVIGCKSCFVNAENSPPVPTYVESLTDSQSNSWTSALITEFDQLKNEKVTEIDLMDDFLEMERLAALPKINNQNQCLEPKATAKQSNDGDSLLKAELEAMINRSAELEEKLDNLEVEKAEMETALGKSEESFKALELQLRYTEAELLELRTELCMANEVKQHLESQLSSMETDAELMSAHIDSLVAEIEKERTLTEQVSINANESKQLLESQLIRIEAEAKMMSAKIDSLEKFEVEKAELETALAESKKSLEASELQLRDTKTKLAELQMELCMANEVKQHLESKLSSMETDIETMSAKIGSLVAEIEKERALSENVLVNANESKQLLESQLISIEEEARLISAKIDSLEKMEVEKVELETALAKSRESLESSELQLRDNETKLVELRTELCMANEVKQHLESQLSSMETDAEMMSAKIDSLEAEIEKERTFSQQVSANANETKQLLESQLISIEAEARMMSTKIDLLETEVKKERALTSQISVRCRELEDTLSRKQHEAKLRQTANSNVESKIKQEDLTVAAGKFAECKKTIASLGQQLKSLATLEDFLIDTTIIPEFSRDPETPKVRAGRYGHSVNKVGKTSPSSFSSLSVVSSNPGSSEKNRNGFAEFLIRSKNGSQLEI